MGKAKWRNTNGITDITQFKKMITEDSDALFAEFKGKAMATHQQAVKIHTTAQGLSGGLTAVDERVRHKKNDDQKGFNNQSLVSLAAGDGLTLWITIEPAARASHPPGFEILPQKTESQVPRSLLSLPSRLKLPHRTSASPASPRTLASHSP